MKIQNKSARLWIGFGLLGLIMFGIRSIIGPFGGLVVEMFSDAGIIFLIVGWYLESRNNKKSASRGFIPLIVVAIIGIVAVGGTVATITIKSKNHELATPKAPIIATVRDQNGQGELINKVQVVSATKPKIKEGKENSKTLEKKIPEKTISKDVVKNVGNNPISGEKKTNTPSKPDPSIALIDTFLNNPTIENLKTFCIAAKNESIYQEVKKTCLIPLGEVMGSENYVWTYYNNDYLLPITGQNESDGLKKKEIEYNEIIASIPPFTLLGYDKSVIRTDRTINTPRDEAEAILYSNSNDRMKINLFWQFNASLVIPEKVLQRTKTQLLRMSVAN